MNVFKMTYFVLNGTLNLNSGNFQPHSQHMWHTF